MGKSRNRVTGQPTTQQMQMTVVTARKRPPARPLKETREGQTLFRRKITCSKESSRKIFCLMGAIQSRRVPIASQQQHRRIITVFDTSSLAQSATATKLSL